MPGPNAKTKSLGTKLFFVVVAGFVVSLAVTAFVTRSSIKDEGVDNLVQKARAIAQEAENARRFVSALRNDHGAFDDAKLAAEVKATMAGAKGRDEILEKARQTGFYWTIPVVAAWNVAQEKAEQAGYKFKVPKIEPRNPKNEPDPVEREMLEELDRTRVEELVRFDDATNSLRYMKPVVLSKDCMLCHGTKADDPDGDGIDPLGLPMEGWKSGDVHGGFEIIADLTPMQARTRTAALEMIGVSLAVTVGTVALLFALIRKLVTTPLASAVTVLERVAEGDLTAEMEVDPSRRDEVARMAGALTQALGMLRGTMERVRIASGSATTASQELANSSRALSESTQEQASSIEETSASLAEMTESARNNSTNAEQARAVIGESREAAEAGGKVVGDATAAMDRINDASRKIAAIITTIDEIAFQTNLLALNAAVEAARAGEQGRGFAVVAAEVRGLAQRSAQSAKEIKNLIEDSVHKVDDGVKFVGASGESLRSIIGSVQKVATLIDEITAASKEQSEQIEQLNKAVGEIDRAVQSNAAQTEELSSVAESLNSQAGELDHSVSVFKLGEGHRAPPVAAAAPPRAAPRATPRMYKKGHAKAPASHAQEPVEPLETVGAAADEKGGFTEF